MNESKDVNDALRMYEILVRRSVRPSPGDADMLQKVLAVLAPRGFDQARYQRDCERVAAAHKLGPDEVNRLAINLNASPGVIAAQAKALKESRRSYAEIVLRCTSLLPTDAANVEKLLAVIGPAQVAGQSHISYTADCQSVRDLAAAVAERTALNEKGRAMHDKLSELRGQQCEQARLGDQSIPARHRESAQTHKDTAELIDQIEHTRLAGESVHGKCNAIHARLRHVYDWSKPEPKVQPDVTFEIKFKKDWRSWGEGQQVELDGWGMVDIFINQQAVADLISIGAGNTHGDKVAQEHGLVLNKSLNRWVRPETLPAESLPEPVPVGPSDQKPVKSKRKK